MPTLSQPLPSRSTLLRSLSQRLRTLSPLLQSLLQRWRKRSEALPSRSTLLRTPAQKHSLRSQKLGTEGKALGRIGKNGRTPSFPRSLPRRQLCTLRLVRRELLVGQSAECRVKVFMQYATAAETPGRTKMPGAFNSKITERYVHVATDKLVNIVPPLDDLFHKGAIEW